MQLCSAVWAVAHLWSVHTGAVPNNNTFGIGIECERSAYNVQLGAFRNSLGRESNYAAIGHDWGVHWQAGLFAGVASGYNYRPVNPIAGARFGYAADRWKVQTLLMPPGTNTPACVHLMVEVRL